MNTAPDSPDPLQRLLKLKRYEKPPPGYFDHFAPAVLARLRENPNRGAWWHFWVAVLEFRPAFAATMAVATAGLYLIGLSLDGNSDSSTPGGLAIDRSTHATGLGSRSSGAMSMFRTDEEFVLPASFHSSNATALPSVVGPSVLDGLRADVWSDPVE